MSHPSSPLSDTPPPIATLAIVNARVWTGDRRRPWADAVLVRGERLELVGSSAEVKKRAGDVVPTIDAKGMMMVPGFPDGAPPTVARIHAAIAKRSTHADAELPAIGVLASGLRADLVLIDRDITRGERAGIDDARIMLTIVAGCIVFDRDGTLR